MRRKSRKFRKPNIYNLYSRATARGQRTIQCTSPGPQVPSKNFVIFCKIFSKILINQLDLRELFPGANFWLCLGHFSKIFHCLSLHISWYHCIFAAYFGVFSAYFLYPKSMQRNRCTAPTPPRWTPCISRVE